MTPTCSIDQVLIAAPSLWIGGPLGREGDMISALASPIPLVLTLPALNTMLGMAVERARPMDLVITRLKGVSALAVQC